MGTRIRINHARWPALILLVSLALTGCFRSAGEDLPPTQPGDVVLVGQNTTPVTPEVPLPTAETTGDEPTAEVATEFPTPIPPLSPFPTLARSTATTPPTLDGQGGPIVQQPPTRVTIQPTFTSQPTQVIAIQPTFTGQATRVGVQPTYTPLPTYTSQPTFTPLPTHVVAAVPTQVAMQPTFTRAAPAAAGQPTTTFTPVPYNPFSATPTYTPYPPVAAQVQVQPVQPQVQVITQAPVEAVPLGEQPTMTLAPGGQGGPVTVDTPPAVAQVATLTPTLPVIEQATPLPPQGPTLTGGQMTATQIVYGATATMAYLMGTVLPPPGGVEVPGQTPIVIQPGQYPPNVTVVTATPLGQPGMCGEHRIAIGDTLSRIALQYGVTTQQVATANNITNPDLIEAGDTLLIPCATPTTGATPIPGQPTTTVPTTGGQQIYTVQAGDNIYRISLRFGVDMGELVRINGLNEVTMNSIYVGQTLTIPASAVIVGTPVPGTPLPGPTLTPYIIIVTPSTIG